LTVCWWRQNRPNWACQNRTRKWECFSTSRHPTFRGSCTDLYSLFLCVTVMLQWPFLRHWCPKLLFFLLLKLEIFAIDSHCSRSVVGYFQSGWPRLLVLCAVLCSHVLS
jgi:hypothetical protein